MNKNIWYAIVGIVIVAVIAIVLVMRGGSDTSVATPTPTGTVRVTVLPTATTSMTTSPSTNSGPSATPTASRTPTASATPTRTPTATPTPSTMTIIYSDTGFSPSTVTVAAGTTVAFKNSSSHGMWPASAQHPTHILYPDQNSCFAGVFTNCTVAPGGTFSYKFNQVGSWGYHDHLNSGNMGRINVQ